MSIQQLEDKKKTRVKVAIRVRPMIARQLVNNDNICVQFPSNQQIILGSDKQYKFDNVFKDTSHQSEVYQNCVKQLVMDCFQGYNAAILAYGQTGSGKTFTMGTSINTLSNENQMGIIPRVIHQIYKQIQQKKHKIQFRVKASFLQIYNEQIKDLLILDHGIKQNKNKDNGISIRQEKDGSVSIYGLMEEQTHSPEEMIELLERGGYSRTTGATLMNDASSRSHAIFTIFIQQHVIEDLYKSDKNNSNDINNNQQGYMTAKFFFVDLAGSQRAKKTGATGATLKQGININLGLLQLGNVISALSTIQKKQDQFITYRNSKLTRILQDCLGGNSNTYMIACVSPAQSNFEQSLNTLKYASKAMNIKNKPIINRDPQSALISQLKQKIFQLQLQNRKYKHIISKQGGGLELSGVNQYAQDDDIGKQLTDAKKIVTQLQKKYQLLQTQSQQIKRKNNQLQITNYQLRRKTDLFQLAIQQLQTQHPQLKLKLSQILQQQQQSVSLSSSTNNNKSVKNNKSILQQYQQKISQLQQQLQDKDKLYQQIQKQLQKMQKNSKNDQQILIKKNKQIYLLSKQISKLQNILNQKFNNSNITNNNNIKTNQTTQLSISSYNQSLSYQNQSQTIQHQSPSTYEQTFQQQLQSQFLGNDNQLESHRQILQKTQSTTNQQLQSIQKYISQKQTYLQQMTKKQINMQYQLISQMKQQYHQKILLLEKQKKYLTKQKDQTISNNQKNKFVNKIDNLEGQLKQYRKKIKQQKNIEKQLTSQSTQIKQLAEEIKKFKFQKLELNRKLKQDKDSFNKLKNQRIKQLLQAKKQNMKKQNMLKKVQMENQKKTLQFRKKDQQIKRVRRVNQTLKNLIKQPQISSIKSNNNSNINNLKKNPITNNNNSQLSLHQSPQHLLSQKDSSQILRSILSKLTKQIDHQKTQQKYSQKIKSLELQMDHLLNDQATFKLKYQKLNLISKQQRTQQQNNQMSQLLINHNDISQRLNSLDDSIKYIRDKQLQMINQQINYFDIDLQILYNKHLTEYIDNIRIFYKSIFQIIKSLLQDNYTLIQTKQLNQSQINQLHINIQQMKQNMIQLNHQHQHNLTKLRQQMIQKQYNYNINNNNNSYEQQDYNNNTYKKIQEKDKKILQRKILDLTKSNSKLCQQVQIWKRKCSIVQEKYHNMKNLTSKDKNIGRQFNQYNNNSNNNNNQINNNNNDQKQQSKQKRLAKNQHMLDQVNDMLDQFEKFDKIKKQPSSIQDYDRQKQKKQQKQNQLLSLDYTTSKWQCMGKIDAHNSAILSMAAHANILISTGTKSLKIWDLQTSKIISDLSGPHLSGFVQYVMVDPQRRLMFTACQKNITIWDLVTLNVQGTLKAHKDKVKTIHINNDLLFTGGKGLANSGSLLVWDLRNLNPNHPMEQKQRNQDIFSFTSKSNILYYGTRNHHVRRMNMTNMQILSPFQPPHMDAVTSLAIVKDKLISGSRDKNLRLWNLDQSINNSKHTFPVFNDFVTSCTSDKQLPIFYAGSKDGQIKVGGVKNDKIQLVGGILAHTQSVNAICPLQQNGNIIVTASADKTIKLWQPTQQTVEMRLICKDKQQLQ